MHLRAALTCALFTALFFPIAVLAGPTRVGSDIPVHPPISGYQSAPPSGGAVATDANGNFLVVWETDSHSSPGVFGRAFDMARRPRGNEFRLNVPTSPGQRHPVVALAPNGLGVVAWQNWDAYSYGVYARRIAVDGTFLGPEFLVNQTTSGSEEQPAIAIDPNGNFIIVWAGLRSAPGQYHDLFARRYDAAGNPLGNEFFIDRYPTGPQEHPAIALQPDGGFVVAWAGYRDGNNYGILARLFDPAGAPRGASFIVNPTTAGVQWQPDLAVTSTGGFGVVWFSQQYSPQTGFVNRNFARFYDSAGLPLTGEVTLSTTSSTPRIAATPEGFLALWSNGDVVGRPFLANGTASGADVVLHGPMAGSQSDASVTTLGEHGVVAFSSYVDETLATDVVATMFTLCDPPAPAPVFVSEPSSICSGATASASVSPDYTSYAWSIVNGTFTTPANGPSVSFNATSTAPVQLSVTGMLPGGCIATTTRSIPVITAGTPVISASGPTTFCEGGSVTLTASAGNSYLWSNGATTQSITVTTSGSYTVAVTGAGGCSATSAPASVVVNPLPTAAITPNGPTTFCEGANVTLTASAGASYLWSTGATTQSIVVAANGSYTVTVTNTNGCSATSAATEVVVNPLPPAAITASGPTTFCEGGDVTLTASAGTSYLWSNGATTSSITVGASGSYTVTVTNANGCSATSSAADVVVHPLPSTTVNASGPTTFCEGDSVTLSAVAGASYLWSNGATTQSIAVNASGSYSVTVTSANGCSATSAATDVVVNPLPAATINASGPTTFCEGGSVTLTASDGASYLWSNGATTQSIAAATSGSYTVTVTNANGCSATSTATDVVVNPLPSATISASGPTTFCEGGSVTLTASAGASYLWSNGGTTQSIAVNAGGSYSVIVTNANGCSATSAATDVVVNPLPSATISASGPTTFCEGGSVTLTASAGASYLWSNGATTQSIAVNAAGSYTVTVTNANGCNATSTATDIVVNPLPSATITATGPTTFCEGGSVTLTASAGASYLWSNGATTQSIAVSASGSYTVTVTNANGCSATSAATNVVVNPLPSATISASGPTTFCNGGSVTLTASAGASYLWSTGATTQAIAVSAGGSYSVTVTNANGCSATSAATNVVVNPLPSATISASGPTTFCNGGSVTLTASAGASWLWSTGATTQAITVSASGAYSVTVTNAQGCSTTSAPASVTANALPPTPSITAGGPTTFCAGGSVTLTAPAGYTYQWSNGATTQSIVATTTGSYSVTVTNASGCTSTSAPTSVTVNAATTIQQQPQSATIPKNTATTVTVTATGAGTLTYQWYKGSSPTTTQPISGATTSSYTTPILSKGTYRYWVRVTGSCGFVNSQTAVITAN